VERKEIAMEEIYIVRQNDGEKAIIAAEPMDEKDFAFSKGQAWNEEGVNQPGYRVRYDDGEIWWFTKEFVDRNYRKMTLQEAEMVVSGQFVIPDSSGSTIKVA